MSGDRGRGITRRGLVLGVLGIGIAGTGVVTVQALTEGDAAPAPRRPGPLLIGSVLPLSGALAADGREMRDGAALAVAHLNAGGGIGGRQVRHVVAAADVTDGAAVATAARELAAQQVSAFVSGYLIDWQAGYDVAASYGAPYLHASSSEEQRAAVEGAGSRYGMVFQTTPTEAVYGSGLVPLLDRLLAAGALTLPSRRMSLLQRSIPHTAAIETGLRTAAAASAWTVATRQDLVLPVTDWSPVLAGLRSSSPDVIVVNTPDPTEAAAFVRAFLAEPLPALLYLAGSADGPFRRVVGRPTEGLLWSRLASRLPGPSGDRFAADYSRAYGRDPGPTLASALYDAVQVLAAAWRTAGDPSDRAAVVSALRGVRHDGVNGGYSFPPADRTVPSFPSLSQDLSASQPQMFLQDQAGGTVPVDPAPLATATWRTPPWLVAAPGAVVPVSG